MSRLIEAGSLNRQIKILRAGIVRDANGDDVDGYTPSGPIWASARPGGGRERLLAAQTAADAPMVFRIRWHPVLADLSPADRVEYPIGGGRSFDIISVNEIGRREGIEIAGVAGNIARLLIVSPPNYLFGAVEATTQMLGSLVATASLAGSVVAGGQISGTLLGNVTLVAALSGAGSVQGTVTARAAMAGEAVGRGNFTGGLVAAARLLGQTAGAGAATGSLSARARPSGQISGAADFAAAMSSAIAYDPDAQAFFNAMTVQPTDDRKRLIDALVKGIKADGCWAQLDRLPLRASHHSQAARLDLRAPGKIASLVNSPTFTVDRGFAGDGTSAFLDLGEPWQALPNYTQDNCMICVWVNQGGSTDNRPVIGTAQNGLSLITIGNTTSTYRLNGSTTPSGTTSARTGMRAAVRSSSTVLKGFVDGSLVVTNTAAASSTPSSLNACELRGNTVYSFDRIAASASGAALTDAQVAMLHARVNTYLTAIGAN